MVFLTYLYSIYFNVVSAFFDREVDDKGKAVQALLQQSIITTKIKSLWGKI
jgi:hypothetical protein